MVSYDEALRILLDATTLLGAERTKLVNALGRVLAEDIVADEAIPSLDNSSMDGFAIRSSDVAAATAQSPVVLGIIGESSAGNIFEGNVGIGEAVRIMTGGVVPDGADAVIPLERILLVNDDSVKVSAPVGAGENVRRSGEDMKKGETVICCGTRITPAHMGILAALGYAKVRVYRQPMVHILATGDELVDIHAKISRGVARNSSSYALAGHVQAAGGIPKILGIVPDKRKRLRKAIENALDCDLLLLTGGVSVGKYDYVAEALSLVGVETLFHGVNIKPGKPLLFGRRNNALVFGLPGNPVSTSVTFLQFVRPALYRMIGMNPHQPVRLNALMQDGLTKKDDKRHFVRGVYSNVQGQLTVKTTGNQGSGVMSSMARANCFIVIPEDRHTMKAGDTVHIELIDKE